MGFFESKEIKQRKAGLSAAPNDPAAHFNLGAAYDQAGKVKDAVHEFEETIKIHPNSAEAHFNLGVLYETLNQGEKAIVHILKAGNLFGEKNDSVNKMEARRLLKQFYKKFGFKPEEMEAEK
ncbi:MAG: tetratricopeptide repeat protein [Nitrospinae bacterium]|nr:tetratricopeptide repeat protein [Nitrospinota bacterium]